MVRQNTEASSVVGNWFPFKTTFSLDPLIEFWRSVPSEDETCLVSGFARNILDRLHDIPELIGPIDDLSVLKKHTEILDALMTPVFPPASWETDFTAAIPPLTFSPFYSTPAFAQARFFVDGRLNGTVNLSEEEFRWGLIIKAYAVVLKRFYDIDLSFDYPIISTVKDESTGLDRFYQWGFNSRFVQIRKTGEVNQLTPEQRKLIYEHATDPDVLTTILPPDRFEFYGFTVFNAVDVTDQEAISSLRLELIGRDTLVSQAGFAALQQRLRVLLRRPDLVLGLASLPVGQGMLLQFGQKIGHSFVLDEACRRQCSCTNGSLYERVLQSGEVVVTEDLSTMANPSQIEREIQKLGIRNLFLAPLKYHGETVGVLELGSKNPADLNAANALKLKDVLPLFATAVHRVMEESNTRVQAVIKEQFTAVHPSVEWKFQEAAWKYIERQDAGQAAELEPIIFKDVYPLYGLSDIRSSSIFRNQAIQADLIDQLTMAKEIVLAARRIKPIPILDELNFRIDKHIESITGGLSSGDEIAILEFLRNDVESLFDHVAVFDKRVRAAIRNYQEVLDPQLKIVYRQRKDFEESVTAMNESLSAYIEDEEAKAQRMFPHYFEKYKSDGVDHTMYIGGAIVRDGAFNPLYLRNLRLFQLMMMCGLARRASRLRPQLKVPLEVSNLILVQSTTMSIRFRVDEKKFDVDGAYNVRYEIIKKRIDKAIVQGREERLTAPGKVAIVYSHPRESAEYRQYIDFLVARGFLTDDVESLELRDLQGVTGLKALRVTVNIERDETETDALTAKIGDAVRAMVDRALSD
jgi:GAF domain-containing protein